MTRKVLESILAVSISLAVLGAGAHAYIMIFNGLPR